MKLVAFIFVFLSGCFVGFLCGRYVRTTRRRCGVRTEYQRASAQSATYGVTSLRGPHYGTAHKFQGGDALGPLVAVPLEAVPERSTSQQEVSVESSGGWDLEAACFEFLRMCDERRVIESSAREWFGGYGWDAVAVDSDASGEWHLLRVDDSSQERQSIVLPTIRKTMGGVSLTDYYEMVDYNGLNPLRPANVRRLCKRLADGTVVKGLIDGN